jgi:hypothetical protein
MQEVRCVLPRRRHVTALVLAHFVVSRKLQLFRLCVELIGREITPESRCEVRFDSADVELVNNR